MSSEKQNRKFYPLILIGIFLFAIAVPVGGYTYYLISENARRSSATPTPLPYIIIEITATPQPTPEAKCGGPRVMYILLAGNDNRGSSYSTGLADAIRVVRVDFVNPSIMMLAFQRDLYVEIPGISDHYGITHGKLNQAYLYGTESFSYYDGTNGGLGLLAVTLEHNFGVTTDHMAAVNLQTFINIVDALGGIDINLPYVVDGRVKGSVDSNMYFPAGEQHLNGYRTMILARLRPNGDLMRNHTQDLILQALAKKVFQPELLAKTPELIEIFKGSVQTSLTATEFTQLLCLAPMIDPQNIRTVSFPDELFGLTRVNDPILGNTSVLEVDFNILRKYVQEFQNGNWPETIPQP